LVPFPFSDRSGEKKRPALVISSDKFNANSQDIVVLAMTSYQDSEKYSVHIKPQDWKNGIYSDSYVKCWAILAIDREMVVKRIGRLGSERFSEAMKKMNEIIGIE
ncbi:MAG: type II toxin-antitoxin system PemK/MazF family toxin, partial [Candidatus Micrarchaeota archaeon]